MHAPSDTNWTAIYVRATIRFWNHSSRQTTIQINTTWEKASEWSPPSRGFATWEDYVAISVLDVTKPYDPIGCFFLSFNHPPPLYIDLPHFAYVLVNKLRFCQTNDILYSYSEVSITMILQVWGRWYSVFEFAYRNTNFTLNS